MIEIWQESASFQTTSQRLADQVRTILNKVWFSGLEIQKYIRKQINKIIIQCQTYQELTNKTT